MAAGVRQERVRTRVCYSAARSLSPAPFASYLLFFTGGFPFHLQLLRQVLANARTTGASRATGLTRRDGVEAPLLQNTKEM